MHWFEKCWKLVGWNQYWWQAMCSWVIYRHPKYACKGFTDDVSATLHYLSDKRLPYIICGDININLLQHTSSSSVRKYIETYESYNRQQIITRLTRVTATSASLIDHFYTTFNLEKVPQSLEYLSMTCQTIYQFFC